jgi:RHS Repeat.
VAAWTHDANGNVTSDGVFTYTWDALGRLLQVERDNTVIAVYAYDSQNRRISKTVGEQTIHYHYDLNNHLIAESLADGTPLRAFFTFFISTTNLWPCGSIRSIPDATISSMTTWAHRNSWSPPPAPWSGRRPICPTARFRFKSTPSPITCVFPANTLTLRPDYIITGIAITTRSPGATSPPIPLGWKAA